MWGVRFVDEYEAVFVVVLVVYYYFVFEVFYFGKSEEVGGYSVGG